MVSSPLKIALISRGKLNSKYTTVSDDSWTLLRFRTGNAAPETFGTIEEILATLIDESEPAAPSRPYL
jgi:hypothetical protein